MIYFKKGKFYDKENVELPLEFGNREQINIIKNQNQRLEELLNEGEEVYVSFEPEDEDDELNKNFIGHVDWRCIKCATVVEIETWSIEENDIDDFNNEEEDCSCGTNYILEINYKNNLILKIKDDKKINITTGKLFD